MLVTSLNKVILHMPRCAGSSIRWAVMAQPGIEYFYSCEHAHISSLPHKYSDFPRIGFVRNPFTWYASWYEYTKMRFLSKNLTKNSVWCFVLSNGFKDDLETFIKNAVNLKQFLNAPGNLLKFKKRIQHIMMNYYLCRYASYWNDISSLVSNDFDCSLYDWYYRIVGLDTSNHLFRIEDQLGDGINFIDPDLKIEHRNAGPGPVSTTPNSKRLIYMADKEYFDKHYGVMI